MGDISYIAVGDSHVNPVVTSIAEVVSVDDSGVMQWSYIRCQFVPSTHKIPEHRKHISNVKTLFFGQIAS